MSCRMATRICPDCHCCAVGEGEARGVEGQVQQLMADAQDRDKLCKMYIGWQAWV